MLPPLLAFTPPTEIGPCATATASPFGAFMIVWTKTPPSKLLASASVDTVTSIWSPFFANGGTVAVTITAAEEPFWI